MFPNSRMFNLGQWEDKKEPRSAHSKPHQRGWAWAYKELHGLQTEN